MSNDLYPDPAEDLDPDQIAEIGRVVMGACCGSGAFPCDCCLRMVRIAEIVCGQDILDDDVRDRL